MTKQELTVACMHFCAITAHFFLKTETKKKNLYMNFLYVLMHIAQIFPSTTLFEKSNQITVDRYMIKTLI